MRACAADSVCDKWELADDDGVELKKCRAAEEAGKQFIADWLAKYSVHSSVQLELAVRDTVSAPSRCSITTAIGSSSTGRLTPSLTWRPVSIPS